MGILINTGFDVGSSSPIDNRTFKETTAERDALVNEGKVYENLKVYCKDTRKEYRWTGTEWEILSSGSDVTDEKVKMEATTDAKYLGDLIDKSTVINDNGVLKVKKLDGQEVTITEINYLKGLTMNVMDLVNMFSNGGVKVWETPVDTYADLLALDRSTFIDGISYIVYVLVDETHSNAKTTYLCDKTNTTFFGNADSQRNFVTNPISLTNEVTGKLPTDNMDVDNLWKLLTINDTYKTLTTNNEVFGTHGAKVMYDELVTDISKKANDDEVIKKTDIKTTLDENSTDTDVCGGKSIFDAIRASGLKAIGKETILYNNNISATGTYTLTDNVNDYDLIIISYKHNSLTNSQSLVMSRTEISKCINSDNRFTCVMGIGSDNSYTSGYFNNNKIIISVYNGEIITSITGYKFGQYTVQNTITNPLQPISYSTDEQLTGGTWIDGKPIYRITLLIPTQITNTYANGYKLADLSQYNIDRVISSMADCVRVSSGRRVQLPYIVAEGYTMSVDVYTNSINANTGKNVAGKDWCITIEYTKKTDA